MKWENYTVGELCLRVTDGSHFSPKEVPEGYPMASSKDMLENDFDYSSIKKISETDYNKLVKGDCKPLKDDILIIKDGNSYLKYIFAIRDEKELVVLSSIAILRPNKDFVIPLFFQSLLRAPQTKEAMSNFVSGAAIPRIVLKDFKQMRVSIPPLPTQRRIASILSAYDDLIENNLKRIKLLEEKAFLRYKQIVKEEETKKISVFEYAEIMSGGTPSTTNPNYWEGEIPFFTPKDLSSQYGYYLDETERKITELGLEKCNSRLFPRDTIFITARGTVGKLVLAKIPSAISQSNYAITTRNGSSNYFLFLALIDRIDHFKQLAVGGVFDTIIVDTFKMIFLELPNQDIIDYFNVEIKPIFQLIDTLQKQNTKLREARDILLPKLMSGQIEV